MSLLSSWDDDDKAKLRRMRTEGYSYAEIALALGRTRNACIGIGQRMGLRDPNAPPSAPRPLKTPKIKEPRKTDLVRVRRPSIEKIARKEAIETADALEPLAEVLTVAASECRWPYADHKCCGRAVHPGKVYCHAHYIKSVQ
jgi:hypothetical protein